MIKILYITTSMSINGVSTVIMNYCKSIEKSIFDVTIISGNPVDKLYIEECKKNNIKLIEIPSKKSKKLYKYYIQLIKLISKKKYDIVHVHGNSATIALELLIAKMKGIKIRIAHCHNTKCKNILKHKFLQPLLRKIYTEGFACSNEAGIWMFKNSNFIVLPNGFETEKFKFNSEYRKKIREELKIENKFVIGHVGRFNDQKNHIFILKLFEEIAKRNDNSILLLVGDGPNYKEVMNIIKNHPYKNQIICYGVTNEVNKVYCAMDLFLLPSKHEGLGIVLLEAQIEGLPCIVSDVVPKETILNKNYVEFLPLNGQIKKWIDAIECKKYLDRKMFYEKNYSAIKEYDIAVNSKYLEEIYINLVKNGD